MRSGFAWLAAMTLAAAPAAASDYSYTSFLTLAGSPQSQSVFVGGINNAGDIVGYGAGSANGTGYLYSKGQFTAVSVPNAAVGTFPAAINNRQQIVGYADFGNALAGFESMDGATAPLTLPDGGELLATGINDKGHVVGSSNAGGPNQTGFAILAGGRVQLVAVPGAASTEPQGIDDNDDIVGTYTDSAGTHGFFYAYGLYARFDVPGATPGTTSARGLNNRGEIVGGFLNKRGAHGYVERDGHFQTLDVPGGSYGTIADGINDSGVIAGSYVTADPGTPHSTSTGFIAAPVSATTR